MSDIFQILAQLNIPYIQHDHPPIFTVAEGTQFKKNIPGGHTKNLFLRNKKGDKHYLVVVESMKQVDLKALGKIVSEPKLSFASPQRLQKYLGLTPGSVSVFGLINDPQQEVEVVVDADFRKGELINCHPNINTATLTVTISDLQKFLDHCGNKWSWQIIPTSSAPQQSA